MALGKRDHGRCALADEEDILLTRRKLMAGGVANADDVVGARVLLLQLDNPAAANIVTAGDHAHVADLELDEVLNLASLNVHAHGVVDSDVGVRVADGARIVGSDVWDALGAGLLPPHLAQLVRALLLRDEVQDEAALDVIEEAERLLRALDGDDVLEAGGEGLVRAHLAVNLHQAQHEDRRRLLAVERVLEAVAEDEVERQAFAQLVRASGGTRRPDAAELVKHPMRRGVQPLQMHLGTARHDCCSSVQPPLGIYNALNGMARGGGLRSARGTAMLTLLQLAACSARSPSGFLHIFAFLGNRLTSMKIPPNYFNISCIYQTSKATSNFTRVHC